MDTSRQFLRWSLPGGIFLLCLTGFQITRSVILGKTLTAAVAVPFSSVSGAGEAFAMIFASIFIGYLITQFYHYMSGRVFLGRFVGRDSCGSVLRKLTKPSGHLIVAHASIIDCSHLFREEMHEPLLLWPLRLLPVPVLQYLTLRRVYRNTSGRQRYVDTYHRNKNLANHLLNLISHEPEGSAIKIEYTTLSDIFNSQGAARVSVLFALLANLAYNTYVHWGVQLLTSRSIGAYVFVTVSALLIARVLRMVRNSTLCDREERLLLGLSFFLPRIK